MVTPQAVVGAKRRFDGLVPQQNLRLDDTLDESFSPGVANIAHYYDFAREGVGEVRTGGTIKPGIEPKKSARGNIGSRTSHTRTKSDNSGGGNCHQACVLWPFAAANILHEGKTLQQYVQAV